MNKSLFLFAALLFVHTCLPSGNIWAQRSTMPFQIIEDKSEIPEIGEDVAKIRKVLSKKANINLKDKTIAEIAVSIAEEFDIKCKVDEAALTDEGISDDQKYDWSEKNAIVGKSLHGVLAAKGLAFAIKDDRLLLTSALEAEAIMETEIYEVSDILASGKAQRVEVVRRGVITSSFDFQQLIELLESICAPDSWDIVGGPGTIQAAEINGKQLLIISQTERTHMELVEFIAKLRKAGGIKKEMKEGFDSKKPVLRIYPLKHDLKSTADDYLALMKEVLKIDWNAEETSVKAIANTIVVKQPPVVHVKILGMLTDLDVLLTPKPIEDERMQGLGGGGGGFF